MKLHLPQILRTALLACMAAFSMAEGTTLVANGVNPNNITSSTRFFDNGKGYYWQAIGRQPWRGAGQLYNQFHNFSFMGELQRRLGGTTMEVSTFGPLLDDENTCWYNVAANVLTYWESYYGVFADPTRTLPYGYTYSKEYLDDLGGTQSLRMDMYFFDNWTNYNGDEGAGGDFFMIAPWYLGDFHDYTNIGGAWSVLKDQSAKAGYFKQWFNSVDSTIAEIETVSTLKSCADALITAFGAVDNGDGTYTHTAEGQIAFIGIGAPAGAGHAMTAYGFTTNGDGTLKSILFANSDDMEYRTFTLYTGELNGEVYLYEDEALTKLWEYGTDERGVSFNWFILAVNYIPTPEALKQLANQYNHGQLTWSGTSGTWKPGNATPVDVALPTAGDGWIIPTSNGNYAASFSADRSVAFTDAAAGSQYGGTVNLGANISTPSMTINNAAVEYVFDGAGAYGLSADTLVKEGSGNATFKRTTITSPNLQVHGGRLTMGEGAALGGNTAATVTGGALAFNGGSGNTTGNITATGGEVAIMSVTQLTTPSLSIGPNAALSFNVTAQQLTSTLLNVTGNVSVDGLVKVNYENWETKTVVVGQAYHLLTTTGTLSVPNPENLIVTSASMPDIDVYDAVLSVEGNTLNLVFTKGNAVYWAGGNSGTWNLVESNIVWAETKGGTPTSYYDSDYYAAHFEDGSGTTNITVGEKVKLTEWNVTDGEYHFTDADKVSPSKRIVVGTGGVMVVDKAPASANVPLIVKEGGRFTMTDDDTLTLWTLDNSGSINIERGNLHLRSNVENGGCVHVGKDLVLAGSSDNTFGELHVDGTVSYADAAGVLRAGGNSVIYNVNGGTLQARDAAGSVTITTTETATLAAVAGPGNIHALGSMHLTGSSNYSATLTVDETFSFDTATTLGNLAAGYIKPAENAVLHVTGNLQSTQLEVSSITTFDSPQYYAGSLSSSAMEFRPTVSAMESVRNFGFLSGDTIYLLRNTGATPSTVANLTLTGGNKFLELNDGKDHVARIAQDEQGNVVLNISVTNILQWVSEDGVWSSKHDWNPNGTTDTEASPTTPVGFLGEGTSTVNINGGQEVKSILLESVKKDYTFVGQGTLAAQSISANGGDHTFGDGSQKLTVQVAQDISIGSRASLTVARNAKLNAGSISAAGSGVLLTNNGQVNVGDINAPGVTIVNTGWITLDTATVSAIVGRTQPQSQAGDVTVRSGGHLNLAKDSRIGYLDNGGTVNIVSAKLTLLQETSKGGNINAGTLNLTSGINAFESLVAYTVNGNSGSLYMGDASNIVNLNGEGSLILTDGSAEVDDPGNHLQNLIIADSARLRFGSTGSPLVPMGHFKGVEDVQPQDNLWTEIHGTFENGGTLVSNRELIFDKKVAKGGNLTAPAITISSSGNVFQDLVTDSITFTSAPSATDAMLYVSRLVSYDEAGTQITLGLTTAPGQAGEYELIDGCGDHVAHSCTLTSAALTMLRREHFDGKLQAKDDDLWLDVIYLGENRYPEINGGNAGEGAKMASAAFFELSPQLNRDSYPDLAKALDGLDQYLATGQQHQAEELAAAVAGASIPALGEAFRGDVERQLRSIRNRTTTMGLNSCCTDPKELPYVNAWINAEGDYRRMQKDGTLSGYKYTTWGGTVGVDVDVTGGTTAGLAVTAMFGDFKSDAADHMDGDLNNYYLTAFVRHSRRAWVQTFVATVGRADADVNRTVNTPAGSYRTSGDTSGSAFGLMYEVGYTIAANEDATTCVQPLLNVSYTHTSFGGYSESGSDAALRVGDMDCNAVTIAAGARVQSTFGENVYNRSSLFEGRALLKGYLGDRDSSAQVEFNSLGAMSHAEAKSAERGAVGLELGAGIYIPVSQNAGTIFWDASFECRQNDMDFNTTVGYRINF